MKLSTKPFTNAFLVVLAMTALGFVFSASAQSLDARSAAVLTIDADCERQAWPAYSADCLLTIDGKKFQRKLRVVASY